MEVTHDTLDVEAYLAADGLPAAVIKRAGSDLWLVRDVPTGTQHASAWSWTNCGDFVRIPVFPYRGTKPDPAHLLAYAWQLGFLARDEVGGVGEIVRLHLVVGSPVEGLYLDRAQVGYKVWLGFGVLVATPPGRPVV